MKYIDHTDDPQGDHTDAPQDHIDEPQDHTDSPYIDYVDTPYPEPEG